MLAIPTIDENNDQCLLSASYLICFLHQILTHIYGYFIELIFTVEKRLSQTGCLKSNASS